MNLVFTWISNAVVIYIFYRMFKYYSSESPSAKERQRKETPLSFDDGVSYARFQDMAHQASRKFKNIDSVTASREGIVEVKWHSNSHKTDYVARIDFNDWGHLTGRYWKESSPGCEMDVVHEIEGYFSGCIRKETRNAQSSRS